MPKTYPNEALASLAKLLRETDGEDVAPVRAAEIRRAEKFLADLEIEAEEFIAAYEGRIAHGELAGSLVDGLLDRLVESGSQDRGRTDLFGDPPEDPDLDHRVRQIVRTEVDRLKKSKKAPQPATRRPKSPRPS